MHAWKRWWLGLACSVVAGAGAAAQGSVFLEDLTTAELAQALRQGTTSVIIAVGGTEQSGPHLTLGKHNARVRELSGRIARELGHTLVAPVVAYVPEGRIDPPTQHMRLAGTLSIPLVAFEGLLEGATRSLWQHGFRDVFLLGDHGGYQQALAALAHRLQAAAPGGRRVRFVASYYRATQEPFAAALRARGLSDAQIGRHAGSADTSLQLATAAQTVLPQWFDQAAAQGRRGGTEGDPRAASAALGQIGADAAVRDAVAEIRRSLSSAH